ncbi:MAG: DUF1501 domain-containing protein [Pseudomonadota bacterium]
MIHLSKRAFLRSAAATTLFGGAAMTNALNRFTANAADTQGYKALVCIFLRGGLDCHDTVLPFDQSSYNDLQDVRRDFIGNRNDRALSNLLELNVANQSAFGNRRFALPAEMAPLHNLFENGNASIIANVGPLLRPTDRAAFDADRDSIAPARLFSHNDQQSTWASSAPEGATTGWGGRFADAALNSNANENTTFTAISTSGNDVFLSGDVASSFRVERGGALEVEELNRGRLLGSGRDSDEIRPLLEAHFANRGIESDNLFEQDIISTARNALDNNKLYNEGIETATPLAAQIPDTGLGRQLQTVADTIQIRNQLNVNRQVFLTSMGGFDSHNSQASELPGRQGIIAGAIAGFYEAMVELGVENDVTLFTISDFGRTLTINGDGTDHGWGGHHFVVGGGVDGGKIFGEMPPYTLDHNQDAGRGRLIPTTAVEQYAATLGRWFGLNDTELNQALPNLGSFSGPVAFL